MKGIFFRDVQVGDVVCQEEGRLCTVGGLSEERDPYIQLFLREGGFIMGRPFTALNLVHRPHASQGGGAEFREVQRLLEETTRRTGPVGGVINTAQFLALLEALQAYELGKPATETAQASEVSKRFTFSDADGL